MKTLIKSIFLVLVLAITADAQTVVKNRMMWATGVKTDGTATTVTAGAYTAGQAVGQLMMFSPQGCNTSANFIANSLIVTDKDDNSVQYILQPFSSNPTNTTVTDNSTFTINNNDLGKTLPWIATETTDHSKKITSLSSLNSGLQTLTPGAVIYGALYTGATTGNPTYTSTSAVVVRLGYICQ